MCRLCNHSVLNVILRFLNKLYQISQFEDVKFEAASILSEFYCQQVGEPITCMLWKLVLLCITGLTGYLYFVFISLIPY